MNVKKRYGDDAELVWRDRKRFLGLPLSFTRYILVKKPGSWFKMFLDVGLLYSVVDELNLYRVCDIRLRQGLLGKIVNTGTVILKTADATLPIFELRNIKNPYKVKDMITTAVEEERRIHNVRLADFHTTV